MSKIDENINYYALDIIYNEYIKGLTVDEIDELYNKIAIHSQMVNVGNAKFANLVYLNIFIILSLIISLFTNIWTSLLLVGVLGFSLYRMYKIFSELRVNELVISGIEHDIKEYKKWKLDNNYNCSMF
jgi:hypothetical protein